MQFARKSFKDLVTNEECWLPVLRGGARAAKGAGFRVRWLSAFLGSNPSPRTLLHHFIPFHWDREANCRSAIGNYALLFLDGLSSGAKTAPRPAKELGPKLTRDLRPRLCTAFLGYICVGCLLHIQRTSTWSVLNFGFTGSSMGVCIPALSINRPVHAIITPLSAA